jgi:hypothetical protein
MEQEQENFKTSEARAKRARSRTVLRKSIDGDCVIDFKWITGQWCWLPRSESGKGFMWNPSGGPALNTLYKKTYWLCMGWSRIDILPEDNPVDVIQNGGSVHPIGEAMDRRKEKNHGGA